MIPSDDFHVKLLHKFPVTSCDRAYGIQEPTAILHVIIKANTASFIDKSEEKGLDIALRKKRKKIREMDTYIHTECIWVV